MEENWFTAKGTMHTKETGLEDHKGGVSCIAR